MRTPSSLELLDAWDESVLLPDAQRAGCLLRHAGLAGIAALPVGELNRRLVELRRRLFGDEIATVLGCPGCGLELDVTLAASALLETETVPGGVDTLFDGYRVSWRQPSCGDLEDAAATGSAAAARALLVERAVISAEHRGSEVSPAELPEAIVVAGSEALTRQDPLLGVELPLTCEECGAAWSLPFDIGAFLWLEVNSLARRILDEVHALASAYGWRERDILELAPNRRHRYLELIGHV